MVVNRETLCASDVTSFVYTVFFSINTKALSSVAFTTVIIKKCLSFLFTFKKKTSTNPYIQRLTNSLPICNISFYFLCNSKITNIKEVQFSLGHRLICFTRDGRNNSHFESLLPF